MDPITTAIVAALASDLAKTAIKNGYNALKDALKRKFGSESDLVEAINGLEKKSASKGRKAILQEEVEIAKVNDDSKILQLAQDLLDKIKEQPSGQQVINQTQTVKVEDVKVGRDFNIVPVQEGGKKT